MENKSENEVESAEEMEAEQGHLEEVKEDEVRAEIISEYGFDEEDDKEKIDKAVSREMGHKKTLSTTIGQKIKYRDQVNKPPKEADAESSKKEEEGDLDSRVNSGVNKALEKRDLDEMDYPDEIKTAIKKVASTDGISIKKAAQDDFIVSKIDAWNVEQGNEEAAITRNNKGGKPSKTTNSDSDTTPPDVDMDTKEGREEYDKWLDEEVKKGN